MNEDDIQAEIYLNALEDKPFWKDTGIFILSVFFFSMIVYLMLGTAIIDGNSMNPTFTDGQRTLVNKSAYWIGDGEYNDIVVFHPVEDYSGFYVKRIIAKPGDTMEIKNNTIYLNDKVLTEPYLNETMITEGIEKFTLKDNEYFLMGDNRNHSSDSRYFGAVDKSLFVGKVFTFK